MTGRAATNAPFFCNTGCEKEFDLKVAETGWRCWKFNSMDSQNQLHLDNNFSSADFPVIRLAEMYLIYAEAQARLDNGITTDAKALGYIKQLRDRAGLDTPASIDLDFILKERACELMMEGSPSYRPHSLRLLHLHEFPLALQGRCAPTEP